MLIKSVASLNDVNTLRCVYHGLIKNTQIARKFTTGELPKNPTDEFMSRVLGLRSIEEVVRRQMTMLATYEARQRQVYPRRWYRRRSKRASLHYYYRFYISLVSSSVLQVPEHFPVCQWRHWPGTEVPLTFLSGAL